MTEMYKMYFSSEKIYGGYLIIIEKYYLFYAVTYIEETIYF